MPRQRDGFEEKTNVDLFPGPRARRPSVLPPSFLVPAIVDALRRSGEYTPLTEMVPGEADSFCARKTLFNGGIVFTGDSDLLLHDLGPQGRVVFFEDIYADGEEGSIYAAQFCPYEICRRLSLCRNDGLALLGFEIYHDFHATLEQTVARAKRIETASSDPEAYGGFLKQYLSPDTAPSRIPNDGPTLDTRVSELALQCLPRRKAEAQAEVFDSRSYDSLSTLSDPEDSLDMFLPSLFECPTRTSAWEASKGIRMLAYQVLGIVRGVPLPSVVEFRRLEMHSSGTRVETRPPPSIGMGGSGLKDLLSKIGTNLADCRCFWITVAICQDVLFTLECRKEEPPSFQLLRQCITGALDQGSWEFVHFLAQTQGFLYSLRMLSQVLEVAEDYVPESSLSDSLWYIRRLLEALPTLEGFPSLRDFERILDGFLTTNWVECLTEVFVGNSDILKQIDAIQKPPSPKKSKKSTKSTNSKKRKASMSARSADPRPASNNPFDALSSLDV